jgi:ABC-type multidrug transport system ATPase subunit
MNESMLHSLMHLFAIIAGINRNTIFSLARNFVESYLSNQLSKKLAEKYLTVYEYYFNEIEKSEIHERGKRTSSLSVKILSICNEINRELHVRNKFQILLSLLQFNRYFESYATEETEFIQSVSDAVETIAEGLLITPKEYQNCKAFITDKFYKVPGKDRILVISDDSSFSFTEIKHLQRKGLNGNILVLQIRRADTYLFLYTGTDRLELNGKYIFPRHVYFLPRGSTIKAKDIASIYYSDITSSFHKDSSKQPVTFLAREISFKFRNSENGIHPFSFYAESGQLIGIMGGSGTGKSTLLKVLNGLLVPDSGSIYINGYDLHAGIEEMEGIVGYIPQDDLLIEDLTVYRNLYYNAKLCLDNLEEGIIRQKVDDLLTDLDLYEVRDLKVGSPLNKFISGGQRKRLNIALELIRQPYVLFVDEPTSGLSSTDSENVMYWLKEQAVKGKLVIVNIHQPSSDLLKLFDRLIVLDKGGYPVYMGNPVEAIVYFKQMTERVDALESECPTCGNINPEEILQIIEARDVNESGEFIQKRKVAPSGWYQMFLNNIQSKFNYEFIREKLPVNTFRIPGYLKQLAIFSARNLRAKLADRQYMLISILVAPILAFILGFFTKYVSGSENDYHEYLFSKNENLPAYLFMGVIVALFLGLIISAEEIIKDRRILARESFLNLSRSSYLLSKIIFLFAMSAIQMITFVLIGNSILEIRGMTFYYWVMLFTSACCANLLGLVISDGLKSVVAIYIIVPFLLVPQILLAGVIVKFDKLHFSVAAYENVPLAGDLMASRWAYEALAVNQFKNNEYQKHFFDVEQAESNISYELYHLIPAITERIGDTKAYLESDPGNPSVQRNSNIIINSLKDIRSLPLKDLPDMKAGLLDIQSLDNINNQLTDTKADLARMRDKLLYTRDTIQGELIRELGGTEKLIALKQENYNENLADLVLNRNELHKVTESKHKLIRKMEPIYQIPSSRNGRAQFYSAVKVLGHYQIDTIWFNVVIIWIMTIIFYIALQFSWLKKVIELAERKGNRS